MNASDVIAALSLPADAQVDQRVPKKLLIENGAPTAAARRQINEGIEALIWVATLKPTTIGISAYQDTVREYLEIAVLNLSLRSPAKAARLGELVHRAVPYPVFLVLTQDDHLSLSLAHKRWAQNEVDKTVLDGEPMIAHLHEAPDNGVLPLFFSSLALAVQPRDTLYALYQGWIDTLIAFNAAQVTGAFTIATSAELAAARRTALQESIRLEVEIAGLTAQAKKEKQINRRVELNLEIKRRKDRLAAVVKEL